MIGAMWRTNRVALLMILLAAVAQCLISCAAVHANESVVMIQDGRGQCSGVMVEPGVVVTARHCDHGQSPTARLRDGRLVQLDLLYTGQAPDDDVLVYALPPGQYQLRPVAKAPPAAGEDVWLVGFPKGSYVSYKAKSIGQGTLNGQLYTGVAIVAFPGWSGGPLFNSAGEVCGILSSTTSLDPSKTYTDQGRSFCVHLSYVQRGLAQACPDGTCPLIPRLRPKPDPGPGSTKPEEAPGSQPAAPEVEWSHVRLLVIVPELLGDGAAGTLAGLGETVATGPLRRTVQSLTDGKASLEVIFERVHSRRYQAVLEAGGLPDHLQLVALVREHNQPGLVRDAIMAKLARIADERLRGAPVEVIFERLSPQDFGAISTALDTPVDPLEPPAWQRPDGPVEEPADPETIRQGVVQALKGEGKAIIGEVVLEKLGAEPVEGGHLQAWRDGGLLGLLTLVGAGLARQWWVGRKAMALLEAVRGKRHKQPEQDGPEVGAD